MRLTNGIRERLAKVITDNKYKDLLERARELIIETARKEILKSIPKNVPNELYDYVNRVASINIKKQGRWSEFSVEFSPIIPWPIYRSAEFEPDAELQAKIDIYNGLKNQRDNFRRNLLQTLNHFSTSNALFKSVPELEKFSDGIIPKKDEEKPTLALIPHDLISKVRIELNQLKVAKEQKQ